MITGTGGGKKCTHRFSAMEDSIMQILEMDKAIDGLPVDVFGASSSSKLNVHPVDAFGASTSSKSNVLPMDAFGASSSSNVSQESKTHKVYMAFKVN